MSDTTASQYQYQKAIIIKGDQEIDKKHWDFW